jgi:hypothetical protein
VLSIYILLVGLWLSTFYWLPFFGFLLVFQDIDVSKNQSRNVKLVTKKLVDGGEHHARVWVNWVDYLYVKKYRKDCPKKSRG